MVVVLIVRHIIFVSEANIQNVSLLGTTFTLSDILSTSYDLFYPVMRNVIACIYTMTKRTAKHRIYKT